MRGFLGDAVAAGGLRRATTGLYGPAAYTRSALAGLSTSEVATLFLARPDVAGIERHIIRDPISIGGPLLGIHFSRGRSCSLKDTCARDVFHSLRPDIEAWLPQQEIAPLIITGHSPGATMATIMAALHEEAELVTFGSPRAGTRAFLSHFTGRETRRHVDCADGVPELLPLGYTHIGPMVYIDRDGRVIESAPGKAAVRRDRWRGVLRYLRRYAFRPRNAAARSLADHAPVNYIFRGAQPARAFMSRRSAGDSRAGSL